MTEGHLASPRAKARIAAAALAGLAYSVGLGAITLGLPPPFAADGDGTQVASVAPGSYVWVLGVRPGMGLEPWPSDAPEPGFAVSFDDGSTVDIATRFRSPLTETAVLALALLAVAVITRRVGLPGSTVALGLSAAAALGPLAPALGYPAALPLAAIPPGVALLDVLGSTPDVGRPRWLFPLIGVFLIGLAVPAVAILVPGLGWPWDLVWRSPGLTVLAVGLVSAWPLVSRAVCGSGSWHDRAARFVGEAFPIARSSRLAGSADERRRLATEMHNEILPQLGQAILELDARDPAGRDRLDEVVGRIRGAMSERQETTLEQVGLVAAIDGYVRLLDIPLELREQSPAQQRAPRRIEHAAYRVAQLAIANAVQHSGADAIRVEVVESEQELRLTVSDDGVGIDELAEQSALAGGHIGLAEMRAQAQGVSARLAIRSKPDEGTTVEFRWTV